MLEYTHMNSEKVLTYTVMFETDAEGYLASVPALPGCVTHGKTFEEATSLIKDAISAYLEVLKEDGDEIPVESGEHIAATVSVAVPA